MFELSIARIMQVLRVLSEYCADEASIARIKQVLREIGRASCRERVCVPV